MCCNCVEPNNDVSVTQLASIMENMLQNGHTDESIERLIQEPGFQIAIGPHAYLGRHPGDQGDNQIRTALKLTTIVEETYLERLRRPSYQPNLDALSKLSFGTVLHFLQVVSGLAKSTIRLDRAPYVMSTPGFASLLDKKADFSDLDAIYKATGQINPEQTFVVDYDEPIEDILTFFGSIGLASSPSYEITPEHFPNTKKGKREVKLALRSFRRGDEVTIPFSQTFFEVGPTDLHVLASVFRTIPFKVVRPFFIGQIGSWPNQHKPTNGPHEKIIQVNSNYGSGREDTGTGYLDTKYTHSGFNYYDEYMQITHAVGV